MPSRLLVLGALVGGCLIFLSSSYGAEGVSLPEQTRGDVTARLTVRVEDVGPQPGAADVRLTLTVVGGPLLQVEPPRLEDPVNAWEFIRDDSRRLDGDRLIWEESLRLRQVKPGPAVLPDVKVRFRDGPAAAWEEVEWVDLLKTARDAPPPEFLPSPPETHWFAWAAESAAAATALAALFWFLSRRRVLPHKPPPEEWALRELADAEPLANGAAYHTRISDIVRRYLAERFALPATRQTTAEFLETVRRTGRLSAEQQAVLRDFLERCDLAKFAPAAASPEECREAAALARSIVATLAGRRPLARGDAAAAL